MWSRVSIVTPPAAQPITVADVKARLRVDFDDEDSLLSALIDDAARAISAPTGVGFALMAQTWRLRLDCFPADFRLPGAPVKSVTAIGYRDAAGDDQVVSAGAYRLVGDISPARVCLKPGASWPAAEASVGAVWVDYVLGESDAANVPADLVTAVALYVGHRFENREPVVVGAAASELPLGFEDIVSNYRQAWIAA